MNRPLRIGLTGGIGSGKSATAVMFEKLGVPVLDLDRVGHAVIAPGTNGSAQLIEAFGENFLNKDGTINRAALANHCFSSDAETAKLNAIMHPLIWRAEEQWLEKLQAPYVIVEASVLLESGGVGRMDGVIVVLADENVRLNRVLARGDRNEKQFRTITARQCGDDQRRRAATWLIENNGSLQALEAEVNAIHRKILATL
ncbi:dephospho-CoA kinase [Mariprofundus ferrinatatus]|uniref:dephospho-CoA kinase n=1 Tax=Mariprofundus ferrinatatus TaxID=1921087 RepID=UPI000C22D1F2|nr:dephospho-CoA kinase [Mariprofundus ferrinatatus]